ncbi:toll/interleukin-1 receptor domain-containing protein [Saccharothrix longispora]|uniref:toll/interleukin-1 receptor domain-containing protein n=1 Tax=Saccharothrix longispora TaxID=33920 RepID=UPI0031ED1992
MAGIFINYRTDSNPGHFQRLLELRAVLEEVFGEGSVFLDVRSIDAGGDYPPWIRERLDDAQIVLAVIHPGWREALLGRMASGGLDWVRDELRIAFENGKVVIPVLVGGATHAEWDDLPPDLALLSRRQGRRLEGRADAEALAEELTLQYDEGFEQFPPERTGSSEPRRGAKYLVAAAVVLGIAAGRAGMPLLGELTAAYSVLAMLAWCVVVSVMFALRKGVTAAEQVVHPLSWRDYNLRVGVPIGFLFILFAAFLLAGATDPNLLGFVLSAFALITTGQVAVLLLRSRRLQQRRLDHWPMALSTPVTAIALRADMARLDHRLLEWERNGKRLPFALRVRCRAAIEDLRRGLRLLARDGRRSRLRWALADHPVRSAVVASWFAATMAPGSLRPLGIALALGAVGLAVELSYRHQRWVRWAVAREVRNHTNELRSRWSVLERRRS